MTTKAITPTIEQQANKPQNKDNKGYAMASNSEREAQAHKLLNQGFKFVLDKPITKILHKKNKNASTLEDNIIKSHEEINKFYKNTDYNISLLVGANGLVIIDVDDHNFNGGSLKELKESYNLPKTLTIKSPTGKGMHYYYKSPEYSKRTGLSKTNIKEVEILAGNKKTVFAPSMVKVFEDKRSRDFGISKLKKYEILDTADDKEDITMSSIAELTGDALKFVEENYKIEQEKKRQGRNFTPNLDKFYSPGSFDDKDYIDFLASSYGYLREVQETERNNTIYKLAFMLRSNGVSEDNLINYILQYNKNYCNPPLKETEVKSTLKSVIKTAKPNKYQIMANYQLVKKTNNKSIIDISKKIIEDNTDYILEDEETGKELPDLFNINSQTRAITKILDNSVVEHIIQKNNIINYNSMIWIYENGLYKPDIKYSYLLTALENIIPNEFITANKIKDINNLLMMKGKILKEDKDINKYPDYYVNLNIGIFDTVEEKIIPHSPKYNSINQIEFKDTNKDKFKDNYIKAKSGDSDDIDSLCPCFNKFIEEIIKGKENLKKEEIRAEKDMLLDFLAACLTKTRNIKGFLWIYGVSNTGKSTLLRIIENIIGDDNVTNLSLRDLTGEGARFQTQRLQNKLLNISADESKHALKYTDMIKKITGKDTIKAEYKGGRSFEFKPYSKLIIASNDLPTLIKDSSDASLNRLKIFECKKSDNLTNFDNLDGALRKERDEIIIYLLSRVKDLDARGWKISDSPHCQELKSNIYNINNSVDIFINDRIDKTYNRDDKIAKTELYKEYYSWCNENQKEVPESRTEFYKVVQDQGINWHMIDGKRLFYGIKLK